MEKLSGFSTDTKQKLSGLQEKTDRKRILEAAALMH